MTNLDPRIGTLNSGRFYAFANGYDQPEVVGTLVEVEAALGLRQEPAGAVVRQSRQAGPMREHAAVLVGPDGVRSGEYVVQAQSRTEARAKIAAFYRTDTPSARFGFYSFAQMRLEWVEGAD